MGALTVIPVLFNTLLDLGLWSKQLLLQVWLSLTQHHQLCPHAMLASSETPDKPMSNNWQKTSIDILKLKRKCFRRNDLITHSKMLGQFLANNIRQDSLNLNLFELLIQQTLFSFKIKRNFTQPLTLICAWICQSSWPTYAVLTLSNSMGSHENRSVWKTTNGGIESMIKCVEPTTNTKNEKDFLTQHNDVADGVWWRMAWAWGHYGLALERFLQFTFFFKVKLQGITISNWVCSG